MTETQTTASVTTGTQITWTASDATTSTRKKKEKATTTTTDKTADATAQA